VNTSALSRQIFRIGKFELDPQSGQLLSDGLKTRLADQPLQILLYLLERRDDVVTREELRQRLWSADTFVDFDMGLNRAMRKLRDSLGDSADRPTYVETIFTERGVR
jgi:DNA-binding winged helix-turn-helix (wHTH) protein